MSDDTTASGRDGGDADVEAFLGTFKRFMDTVLDERLAGRNDEAGPSVADDLSAFLGADVKRLPIISEAIASHRLVDADTALREIAGAAGPEALIGVGGGQQRHHSDFQELLSDEYGRFRVGPIDFGERATGPGSTRQVVAFGIWKLDVDGARVAVLQRDANNQFGRQEATLDLVSADIEVSRAILRRIRELMVERSVLRGQVLSFEATEYGMQAGATFVERPKVDETQIVLPPGVLDQVRQHVIGIGDHRDALLAAGQHLKRGVLLYGPPGTGKTLTVRHLISSTAGTTAVLLTGSGIQFIGAAAEIARTFQPSIVVLEDIDLVASDRDYSNGPQPLLFEVLDALDGLAGDADVTFLMTTNRVDVLEAALSERPGRVDLAVEIPLPDGRSRRELFRRYANGLPFSDEALDAAAARAEGTTGSFAKELMRRAVLAAAVSGRAVTDADLGSALDALLSDRETLTRSLLGGGQGQTSEHDAPRSD